MDNSFIRQHPAVEGFGLRLALVYIDGSELSTTTGVGGVDIGKDLVTAKDDGSNTVTLTFLEPLPLAPKVVGAHAFNAVTYVKVTTASTTQIVYSTVAVSDGSSAAADADVALLIALPEGFEVS